MIVTTSATTVTTVTYLSVQELENYKKQFQSFWLPFMEQFIPATTIWVAGERWCNDPCPTNDVCRDFNVSPVTIPLEFNCEKPPCYNKQSPNSFTTTVVSPNNSLKLPSGTPTAEVPKNSPNILPIKDLGLTSALPVTVSLNTDLTSYRSKFTEMTIETIVV